MSEGMIEALARHLATHDVAWQHGTEDNWEMYEDDAIAILTMMALRIQLAFLERDDVREAIDLWLCVAGGRASVGDTLPALRALAEKS